MLGKGRSGTRIREMGQKGFTLIELLIVVAILGALAAIVIPNVGRFIGRGETEAKDTEFANVQSAVVAMMVDNELATLPNPRSAAINRTNNMGDFPDTSTCGVSKLKDIDGNNFSSFGDKDGYILYGHDRIGDNSQNDLVNYVATGNTSYWYTVDTQGTITQYDTAP
jgi:prepilin-type N-terminal cleavage/methylation domain-containing protein